jgi:hypothetical protein
MSFETCNKTRISHCCVCCYQTSRGILTYGKEYYCVGSIKEAKLLFWIKKVRPFFPHTLLHFVMHYTGIQACVPVKFSETNYYLYAVVYWNLVFSEKIYLFGLHFFQLHWHYCWLFVSCRCHYKEPSGIRDFIVIYASKTFPLIFHHIQWEDFHASLEAKTCFLIQYCLLLGPFSWH